MDAGEQRRTEAAIWQSELLCDAAVYPACGKARTHRRLLLKRKEALYQRIFIIQHVLRPRMRSGESRIASLLTATHRKSIHHRFDFLFQNCLGFFFSPRCFVCLFFASKPRSFFVCLFVFLQTCSVFVLFVRSVVAKYQLGNITEVCEERAALASIHARSTLGYLLWNCEHSWGTVQHMLCLAVLSSRCLHVRTRCFEDIFGKMLWIVWLFCRMSSTQHLSLHGKHMRGRAWTSRH